MMVRICCQCDSSNAGLQELWHILSIHSKELKISGGGVIFSFITFAEAVIGEVEVLLGEQ